MIRKTVLMGLMVVLGGPGLAAEFCVQTSAQLQGALIVAGLNQESDHIKVVQGTYPTNATGGANNGFSFVTSTDPNLLKISGGWVINPEGDCAEPRGAVSPLSTVLDGLDMHRILDVDISSNMNILHISKLTFANGHQSNGTAAGLNIQTNPSQQISLSIVLYNNAFLSNVAAYDAALVVEDADVIRIQGNVFQHNASGNRTAIRVKQLDRWGLFFSNNSILNNPLNPPVTAQGRGAVVIDIQGLTQALIINNLIWDNDNLDLLLAGDGYEYLYHNNISLPVLPSLAAEAVTGNLSLDPLLFDDYYPDTSSPLVNAGFLPSDFPVAPGAFFNDWGLNPHDFLGQTRVWDGRVDIGAVENVIDLIYYDGFESP